MHNTSTEYKQWNDNWILVFICFVGRLLLEPSASSSSSFIISSFLIQMLRWIRDSSRVEIFIFLNAWGILVDKRFFKSWVLHIPHRLRDLLCMVRAWSLVSSIFPSILMNRASSSSFTASSFFLIWETLVKYDCMVSAFWIFILQLVSQIHLLVYVLPFK